MSTTSDAEQLKLDWLKRLGDLIEDVRTWATNLGWSTRKIETSIDDSQLGRHTVPAILIQRDTTRILIEPIARLAASGADGVVDLYLLPAYDDIASIYHYDDGWHLHYMFPKQATATIIQEAESKPFSASVFENVVEEMVKNAV